jgi:TPR repeat protein
MGLRMRYRVVFAAAVMAGMTPVLAAQTVKAGVAAWQKADYPAAVAAWRPLAEAGDADAAFNLGQAYRLGRGVPTDLALAQGWFEKAARKGHVDATTTLGLLLFENGNQVAGLRWLKQAADKGEPRALLVYGTALFNGDSLPRDPVLGYAFVSRAAAQGLAPAKQTLAGLDRILPLDQRKKGVAVAINKAKTTPAPTSKPPTPAKSAAKVVAPTPPGKGGWRIQLGAFSRRSSAEALFGKLAASGPLSGRSAYYVPVGAMTRLQAGPFESRAAAQAACAALKGQACFPVAAK